jgi:LPS-assembly protein
MRPLIFRPSPSGPCRPAALLVTILLALTFIFTTTGTGRAADLAERMAGDPNQPWQISADTVDYDAPNTTYHARGNVVIEKEATRLVADTVAFNNQAMTASAAGHVLLTVGKDVLSGDQLDLDLGKETGVLHGGMVFIQDTHFYIRGDRIEKTGPDTYRAERASLTTCDGENPDWIITGRDVKVTIEGYGSATHAVFRAGSMPVLYAPYFIFPVKTKRQTGLLFPEIGYADRKGFYWEQPFFWAINDQSDATITVSQMTDRGTKLGLEYRWALTEDSFGTIMADGLEDRRRDDGTAEATDQSGYDGDAYDRPNTDRYWLRAKADQELPFQAMAHLDLDVVSDQDYLDDFRDGPSGFYASRDAFLETFGRDIDTYDETIRTNRLNVARGWAHYSLNADLLWNDNVVKRRWSDTDDTLQQLPVVAFDSTKQRILGSGLFWDVASEYTYFYRQDGDRGHRMDMHPRTYLPLKWKNYLSIEPSAGFRQTTWVMDRWEDEDQQRTSDRQIPDFELDVSTEIARVMGSPIAAVDRIRHSIKPQVVYEYIPERDQSDLPYFTSTDRIEEANRITYSLTNTFTARMPRKTPSESNQTDDAAPDTDGGSPEAEDAQIARYYQFCRIYLEQSYDIAAARENDPHPFSALYGELDLKFAPYFSIAADATYDTNQSRFTAHNLQDRVADQRGDALMVEHRYKTNVNESIQASLSVVLTDRITLRGEYERNLLDEKEITRGIGLLYKTQCWAFDLFVSEEKDDLSVGVLFSLTGLGKFGR